jgi:hypothetical protein
VSIALHDPPRPLAPSPRETGLTQPHTRRDATLGNVVAIVFGCVTTLCITGYQFGHGNHTVYLLEPLRLVHPELLTQDWFTTGTLQYHAVFARAASALMKLGIVEPAFLAGYLLLVLAWHVAWLGLTIALGGTRLTYALSVVLYYLSAAGVSLGAYQFLQDGAFLPSNVASVAMLWGLWMWSINRRAAAGVWLGLSGMLHLNWAVVAVGLWVALQAWDLLTRRRRWTRDDAFGSAALLVPCLLNVGLALSASLRQTSDIPLEQFVRIYVLLRHAHHVDPLSWPVMLWISFLWPMPLAVWAYFRRRGDAQSRIARVFVLIGALQLSALVFAGVWFVSETLVQLMLWRFSIYLKLIACIGAAYVVCDTGMLTRRGTRVAVGAAPLLVITLIGTLLVAGSHAGADSAMRLASDLIRSHFIPVALFAALCAVPLILSLSLMRFEIALAVLMLAVAAAGWGRWLGLGMTPERIDPDYLQVCQWARQQTPIDATFLVPPGETAFRLHARRAIVVNFKHVPQLSGELLEWSGRLAKVLGVDDLTGHFPDGYVRTLGAMDERYAARGASELAAVARDLGARYVVAARDWGDEHLDSLVFKRGRYFVYDLGR